MIDDDEKLKNIEIATKIILEKIMKESSPLIGDFIFSVQKIITKEKLKNMDSLYAMCTILIHLTAQIFVSSAPNRPELERVTKLYCEQLISVILSLYDHNNTVH